MAAGFGKSYGLRDVKVKKVTSGTETDLPVARTLSFQERISNAELRGDDSIAAVVANTDAVEWTLESGGISLDALEQMTGRTAATSGTTPNEVMTLTASAGDVFPYIIIEGKSVGDGIDDVHVKFWKAKVTSLQGSFTDQEFFVTELSGIAIDDGTNGIYDIVHNETAAAISL